MRRSFLARAIDALVIMLILCLAIGALIWFVHTFNVFELPSFIDRLFVKEVSLPEETDSFEADLLKLIESRPYFEGEYEFVSLTADKAIDLISSINVASDFYWEVETVFSYNSAERKQLHRIYKKGDRVRIDTIEENEDLSTVISNGITTTVNNKTGETVSFSGDTEFSYTDIVNIAALEYALDGEPSSVNEIAIVELENEKYLYAEIPKKDINGIDRYFISLDCGLVLEASSAINEREYFFQNTLSFDASSVISDKAFEITDSEREELLILQ